MPGNVKGIGTNLISLVQLSWPTKLSTSGAIRITVRLMVGSTYLTSLGRFIVVVIFFFSECRQPPGPLSGN
jgi:hypothetical protein